MLVFDIEQGSEDWRKIRCGKITASRVEDILAEKAGRKNYIAELVCERLTGEPSENGYVSKEMQWGTDHEAEARTIYEFSRNVSVRTVGFAVHDDLPWAGASPDGVIGEDGMVEIKCPNTATHIEMLRTGKIPLKYIAQMQWSMECADRQWCDYVSYNPRIKRESLVMVVRRVERDYSWLTTARSKLAIANAEIDAIVAELERIA